MFVTHTRKVTIDPVTSNMTFNVTIDGYKLQATYSQFGEGALQITNNDVVIHESYNYGTVFNNFPQELTEFDNVQWWLSVVFRQHEPKPRRCIHPGELLSMHCQQKCIKGWIRKKSNLSIERLNGILACEIDLTDADCVALGRYFGNAMYWRTLQDTFNKSEKSCQT